MYFDINLKLLSRKKYSKSKQTKFSGFVKLGVRWAERDKCLNLASNIHIGTYEIGHYSYIQWDLQKLFASFDVAIKCKGFFLKASNFSTYAVVIY